MTAEHENLIDRFVEYLIIENCEGCKLCEPRLSSDWSNVVCMNEGETKWLMHMAENFKKGVPHDTQRGD